MRKLKALSVELGNILNEAYIEQQALLYNTNAELQDCKSNWNSLAASVQKSTIDKSTHLSLKTLESQLKHQLKHLYDQVSLVVDSKATILQLTQSICHSYEISTTSIGKANGVLHTEKKVALITAPYFQPILCNRLFLTVEVCYNPVTPFSSVNLVVPQQEEAILAAVRSIWASAILKSSSHTLLAERQLSAKVSITWVICIPLAVISPTYFCYSCTCSTSISTPRTRSGRST